MFEHFALYTGLIATLWLLVGVWLASLFYDGYSHSRQFCSELGASGSPTEKLSPIINNYPLGLLFCVFGWAIAQQPSASIAAMISGILIIIHGIGTWVAGYFPMDADPYTKSPTINCKVHSWAGFIMLLSLLIAPLVIVFSSDPLFTNSFKAFSVISVVIACYYLYQMAKAFKDKKNAGIYQRISYGAQLIWLSALSFMLT